MDGFLKSTVFVAVVASSSVQAEEGRQIIDPATLPISKAIVQITQLEGVADGGAANGFIIGNAGCHVLTNFHVAFAKDKRADGSMVLVEDQEVGHTVNIGIDLDPRTGIFRRLLKARVLDFGNYEEHTTEGMRGDISILKLDDCLGEAYGILKIMKVTQGHAPPVGLLSTLSVSKIAADKSALFLEKGCAAADKTPIAGLFVSTCMTVSGMSGSPVIKFEKNGKYTVVGMSAGHIQTKNGQKVSYALNYSLIAPFVESVLGGDPMISSAPDATVAGPNLTTTSLAAAGK